MLCNQHDIHFYFHPVKIKVWEWILLISRRGELHLSRCCGRMRNPMNMNWSSGDKCHRSASDPSGHLKFWQFLLPIIIIIIVIPNFQWVMGMKATEIMLSLGPIQAIPALNCKCIVLCACMHYSFHFSPLCSNYFHPRISFWIFTIKLYLFSSAARNEVNECVLVSGFM